eukprot:15469708-Alexandrium_andersonii.AAC.1
MSDPPEPFVSETLEGPAPLRLPAPEALLGRKPLGVLISHVLFLAKLRGNVGLGHPRAVCACSDSGDDLMAGAPGRGNTRNCSP